MRLTLRTLLAYLDNTLDPQDAQKLRDKLAESGFATQLVQRIRGTLANGSLLAPSPEAVGPVEEANVICEYLDSTLPSEQVAEIERACLESDPHLAEAAACHQILTMVLGKPAEVSPELRQRIYELPDRRIDEIAASGSFSSVAIPDPQPLQSLSDELPTAELTSPSQSVEPVGVADSGVSDAPTRIREFTASGGGEDGLSAAIAGSSPRGKDDSMAYARSIRPSRIAPWLVFLALAGVLLFVLTRIFQPLLNNPTASLDKIKEIEVAAEQAPIMVDIGTSAGDSDSSAEDAAIVSANEGDGGELPAPDVLPAPDAKSVDPEGDGEEMPAPVATADTTESRSASEERPTSSEPVMADAKAEESAAKPDVESVVATEAPTGDAPTADSPEPGASESGAAEMSEAPPSDESDVADVAPPPPSTVAADADMPKAPAEDAVEPVKKEIAQVTSDQTLVAALVGDQWVRLKKEMMVGEGLTISCAPTFRAMMSTEDVEVTLIGPAQVQWLVDDSDDVTLRFDFGHALVSAKKPNTLFKLELDEEPIDLTFADIDSTAGVGVEHSRAPGFDPLQVEYRLARLQILSVQGSIALNAAGKEQTLQTGQQWVKGEMEAKVLPVEEVPTWVDPPQAGGSLEASAREGLLELVKGEQPLEIMLREAALFRRSEVAALAGQTLLNLGFGDVYFGGDGLLSEPKQRNYWYDHYQSLLFSVDQSAESAARLRESIVNMDSANAQPLFRLLTGFSQKQLVEGSDEELVELLDSPSMAVRVLALENLQEITGTTLYFRAEQENAVRRAPVIKKWIARQRKGDIRWQD